MNTPKATSKLYELCKMGMYFGSADEMTRKQLRSAAREAQAFREAERSEKRWEKEVNDALTIRL